MKCKIVCLFLILTSALTSMAQPKLHVVITGLSHDHVNRILDKNKTGEIIIAAIVETDKQLVIKKQAAYQLPDSIFYTTLTAAIKKVKPDLVLVFNAPSEHLAIVQICMPLHTAVMFEKPLCFSMTEAKKMEQLSKKFQTKIFTNFPSIWYTGFMELLKRQREIGTINKMVMHGGHQGPVAIGVSKEFSNWLIDSNKNGGGAITDFGCYGASIMTALMNGQKPKTVFAVTQRLKPAIYKKVDDDATIVLEYPAATGIIAASWNWPFTIMDVEVYSNDGYYHAVEFNKAGHNPFLESRKNKTDGMLELSVPQYKDEIAYLTAVIKNGAEESNRLLSLEYNLVIVSILDAARMSAKTGKKISL